MKKFLISLIAVFLIASNLFAQFGTMNTGTDFLGKKYGHTGVILEFPARMDSAHSGATVATLYSETFSLAAYNGDANLLATGACQSVQANDSSAYVLAVVGALDPDIADSNWVVIDTIASATDCDYYSSDISSIFDVAYPYFRLKVTATVANLGRNHTFTGWIYIPKKP